VPDGENVIVHLARRDISDPTFLRNAVRSVLEQLLPANAVPSKFTFNLIGFGESYIIDTDLDFVKLNEIYHQNVPPSHSSLNCDYLLLHVISARADSYFAADYMAEIVTTPLHSRIMRLKYLKLLDEAQRFRGWLHGANPDSEIVASYVKAATEKTWADKLPTKTTRWALATAIGAASEVVLPTGIGAIAGAGVGALDALYLDRFIKGWRPNHFIEGPYKEFVEKGS
jgi:hypothetical protein